MLGQCQCQWMWVSCELKFEKWYIISPYHTYFIVEWISSISCFHDRTTYSIIFFISSSLFSIHMVWLYGFISFVFSLLSSPYHYIISDIISSSIYLLTSHFLLSISFIISPFWYLDFWGANIVPYSILQFIILFHFFFKKIFFDQFMLLG